MFKGSMPDITPGQIGAILTFVVAQIVAWGWVSNDQGQVLVSSGGIVIAAAWKIADALLRGKRAEATAARKTV